MLGRLIAVVPHQEFAQHRPCEDINPHRSLIALGLPRLFLKFHNAVFRIRVHDAEAVCFRHGHLQNGDGGIRPFFHVVAQHGGIIHFIDMVAGKDQHIFRGIPLDEADVLADSVRRAGIPLAAAALDIRRKHINAAGVAVQVPRAAVTKVPVELERLVLRQHAHGIHAGVDAVGQRKVDDAVFPPEGNRRFCRAVCEHAKARALPAGQQHCNHAFLDHTRVPPFGGNDYSAASRRVRR